VTSVRHQKLFFSASVLGAAIAASDNCHHSENMRLRRAGSSRIIRKVTHYPDWGAQHRSIGKLLAPWGMRIARPRVKSAIVFSFMVDGSGYCGCRIFGRLRPAGA
jgi:hypothetical protein